MPRLGFQTVNVGSSESHGVLVFEGLVVNHTVPALQHAIDVLYGRGGWVGGKETQEGTSRQDRYTGRQKEKRERERMDE